MEAREGTSDVDRGKRHEIRRLGLCLCLCVLFLVEGVLLGDACFSVSMCAQ
jgi:hypothetical protein